MRSVTMDEETRLEALRYLNGKTSRISSKSALKDNNDGNHIIDTQKQKRPFLKRGSGLYRFYKDGQCLSAERAKRKSVTDEQQTAMIKDDDAQCVDIVPDENLSSRKLVQAGSPLVETPKRSQKSVHFKNDIDCSEHSFMSQRRREELEDLRVFEALEKASGTSSFCSTSSIAARFLHRRSAEDGINRNQSTSENMGSDGDLYSSVSSLGSSEDEAVSDKEDVIVIEDEDLSILNKHAQNFFAKREPQKQRNNTNVNAIKLTPDKDSSDRVEQLSRLQFLEDRVEKMTLEWWSYKEQMVDVFHGMQSKLTKIEIEHEAMHRLLLEKVNSLESELKSRSQNCIENYVEVSEKAQVIEDEQKSSTRRWEKCAKQFQKDIDALHLEISRKFTQIAENVEEMKGKCQEIEENVKVDKSLNASHHDELDWMLKMSQILPIFNMRVRCLISND